MWKIRDLENEHQEGDAESALERHVLGSKHQRFSTRFLHSPCIPQTLFTLLVDTGRCKQWVQTVELRQWIVSEELMWWGDGRGVDLTAQSILAI